ncbi:hypothetical protein [Dictyobacter arantiisoli]|uniref:Fucose-specific lectin n=1 Tax=Dictyobacter arantiisoli TaxID=2014874 RepID=A0A5A5TJW0_9CHLR|nr:hypothetical protein [Dictyobacter arantiisoli]GCF11727.1 hypothetical protein KDI_52910 [Dictyobacter arantiisoli]
MDSQGHDALSQAANREHDHASTPAQLSQHPVNPSDPKHALSTAAEKVKDGDDHHQQSKITQHADIDTLEEDDLDPDRTVRLRKPIQRSVTLETDASLPNVENISFLVAFNHNIRVVTFKYKENIPHKKSTPSFMLQRSWEIQARKKRFKLKYLWLSLLCIAVVFAGGMGALYYLDIIPNRGGLSETTLVAPSSFSPTPDSPAPKLLPVQGNATSANQWLANGSLFTVYLDTNKHVQLLSSSDGQNWQQKDLTRETGSAQTNGRVVTSYSWDKGNTQQVAYIDVLGHIHLLRAGIDNHWSVLDVTQITHAPLANGAVLKGFDWLATGSQQLVYIDRVGHIQQLSSLDGNSWQDTDVTSLTHAPPANGIALTAFPWTKTERQQIAYIDTHQHILELSSDTDGHWSSIDLTLIGGAPLANGNVLTGYEWRITGQKYIEYIDTQKHIQELMSQSLGTWTVSNVTNRTNRPLPDGRDLAAFDWIQGGSRVILFVDANHHMQELAQAPQNNWNAIDLTQISSAPLAANDAGLVGYIWSTHGIQMVVFVDSTNHLDAIFSSTSGIWQHANW